MIRSVDALLEACGGDAAVMKLTGHRSSSALSNWRARGSVPSEFFILFSTELRRRSRGRRVPAIDPKLFGMVAAEGARA